MKNRILQTQKSVRLEPEVWSRLKTYAAYKKVKIGKAIDQLVPKVSIEL